MKGRKPSVTLTSARALGDLPAPRWLSKDAKAEWRRVMPILTERRTLTEADLGALENYCVAMGGVREMERTLQEEGHVTQAPNGMLKRHPAVAIQADAMNRARLLAAELGLTPVSRSRPAVRDADNPDSTPSPLDM